MADTKARELMRKHDIRLEDLRDGKHTLHHLRAIVHGESLPFEVFHALVRMRR